MDRQPHVDWEAIFHGSQRSISTVAIGCEADFRSRNRFSKEERVRLIRRLKEYVNLSYDSQATIAAKIGADEGALNGWLAGKVKPTFQSLLKVRDFLERQVETGEGIGPIGYGPIRGNNPNGRRGKGGEVKGEKRLVIGVVWTKGGGANPGKALRSPPRPRLSAMVRRSNDSICGPTDGKERLARQTEWNPGEKTL